MKRLYALSRPVECRDGGAIAVDLNALTSFAGALDTVLLHGEKFEMGAEDITAACFLSQHVEETLGRVAADLRMLLDHVSIDTIEEDAA